jgi:hypothetical protein
MARGALSTPIGRGWKPGPDRRIYILWMALVWAGMLAGFLPDFGRFQAEAPKPPFVLNLHGVVFTAWLVMVTAQIALAEAGKPALHKQLG